MTAVAVLVPRDEPAAARLFAVEPTLDVAVSRAWDRLRAGAKEPCLMCGGEMEPRPTAGRAAGGGRCRSCGTVLE